MQIIRTFLSSLRDNKGKQQWRSVIAGKSGGTSRWSHGFGYLFGAFRRDGLISDQLSLQLPTFFRSLDLFLKLRVRTVPHSLTTNQPRDGGKQDKHAPELSRFHSSTGIHGKRRASLETNTGLVNKLRTRRENKVSASGFSVPYYCVLITRTGERLFSRHCDG